MIKQIERISDKMVWGFRWIVRFMNVKMEIDYSKLGERTREGKTYDETMVALQELYFGRKALRVNPRGKQWLAVYRAHQFSIFGVHAKIFPSINLFLKRIDIHNECIPG